MSGRSASYRPAKCHREDCWYAKKGQLCWGQVKWEDDIVTFGSHGGVTESEPLFACRGHDGASVGEKYKPEPVVVRERQCQARTATGVQRQAAKASGSRSA